MNEPERHGANTDTSAAPGGPAANEPQVGSDLAKALEAAQAKATEHYDAFLRAKAEAENIRRRAQEDISKAHKYAIESFAEAMVPVVDSLEKALETQNATAEQLREGAQITLRQLQSAFERNKLVAINPVGEKFDPHKHQAISMVPAEAPANQVVAVLQKGWMIADRVLRPALVTVSQGGGNSGSSQLETGATTAK